MYMQKANKNNVATTSVIKNQQKMQYFSTVEKTNKTNAPTRAFITCKLSLRRDLILFPNAVVRFIAV